MLPVDLSFNQRAHGACCYSDANVRGGILKNKVQSFSSNRDSAALHRLTNILLGEKKKLGKL